MAQKQVMLQPLMVEPLLVHSRPIIIFAMTGGTKAEKNRVWIADIMVAVGGVQVNAIAFSCTFGFPFFPLRDMAKHTPFSCLFLTLSGQLLPILGILLSPFAFHTETPLERGVPHGIECAYAGLPLDGQVLCALLPNVRTECLLSYFC